MSQRIYLTIAADYVNSWSTWQAVREIGQNARDAEIQHGARLTVEYKRGMLAFENEGCTIPRKALLMGGSDKAGRQDLAGKYGEGLKLGLLALARKGIKVVIRNGSEVWRPEIVPSDQFQGSPVLAVDVTTGNADRQRVRVEIPCEAEAWTEYRDRFLFLAEPSVDEKVATDAGDLLLGERFRDKVFVKGIYVQDCTDLRYGYNFRDADLDRDRRMVESYDAGQRRQQIWEQATAQRPDLTAAYLDIIEQGGEDASGLTKWSAPYASGRLVQAAAARFAERHGADAVAVANIAEGKDLEHLGRRGVVVSSEPLRILVQKQLGSPVEVQAKLREEVVATPSWSDLSLTEQKVLEDTVMWVSLAVPELTLAKVDVVEFRSDNIDGMHKDSRYLLARRTLATPRLALKVLVHEVAHDNGGDGDHGHVVTMERIWSTLAAQLLGWEK